MYKLKLLLCADTVIRDAQTNNISIINLYEDLSPEAFPSLLPHFMVLVLFEREIIDPNILSFELQVVLNQQEIFKTKIDATFQDKIRTRNIIFFNGFPLNTHGLLEIIVKDEENIYGNYQIIINKPKLTATVEMQQLPLNANTSPE